VTTPHPTPTKRTLQRDRILRLAHLHGERGFTRRDAAMLAHCYELASRVMELEAEGCTFTRTRERGKNTFGDPVRFTRYHLVSAPPAILERAGIRTPAEGSVP
jgi:hypothetical protein